MRAGETKVESFLAKSQTVFAIPIYQRNYDWTMKECQQLLNDIIRIGSNDDNAHFIGSNRTYFFERLENFQNHEPVLIDEDVYHIGASLKDLGKKLFAFSKMKMNAVTLLQNIFCANE